MMRNILLGIFHSKIERIEWNDKSRNEYLWRAQLWFPPIVGFFQSRTQYMESSMSKLSFKSNTDPNQNPNPYPKHRNNNNDIPRIFYSIAKKIRQQLKKNGMPFMDWFKKKKCKRWFYFNNNSSCDIRQKFDNKSLNETRFWILLAVDGRGSGEASNFNQKSIFLFFLFIQFFYLFCPLNRSNFVLKTLNSFLNRAQGNLQSEPILPTLPFTVNNPFIFDVGVVSYFVLSSKIEKKFLLAPGLRGCKAWYDMNVDFLFQSILKVLTFLAWIRFIILIPQFSIHSFIFAVCKF